MEEVKMDKEKFAKSDESERQAHTVGELKKILAEVDDDLPVEGEGLEEGVIVVLYNAGHDNEHIAIETIW